MNDEELKAQDLPPEVAPSEQPPIESPAPTAENLSPYDTTAEQAEMDGINKELQDIEASVENDFISYISDLIDNDSVFEELFFSDRKAFFKKVIEEQNNFVSSLIEPRAQRMNELQGQIAQKTELGNLEAIKQNFQAQHPDVDVKELIRFFTEDLSPKVQEQIKEQPIEQFFNIVYEIMKAQTAQAQAMQNTQQNPTQETPTQDLPAQAQGVAVDSEQANSSAFLPMNRN